MKAGAVARAFEISKKLRTPILSLPVQVRDDIEASTFFFARVRLPVIRGV